jgi:prepilin-type processing-associated H-X9-DG protein
MFQIPRTSLAKTRTRRGLSLAETIVTIIALVAIAASVIPAGNEARRQSKEVRCLGHLGRITHATAINATISPDEFALPTHPFVEVIPGVVGEYEWGGKSGVGEPTAGVDVTTSKWGTAQGRGPATRGLNAILYKDIFPDYRDTPGFSEQNWLNDANLNLDVYRCPSDYGYTGHHLTAWKNSKLTSFDHYGNSYVASTSWLGVSGGACRLASISSFMRPVSTVPNPARTILVQENAGRFGWRTNYGVDGCSFLSGAPLGGDIGGIIRAWHGEPFTFNLAFVDGHAARTYVNGHIHPQPDMEYYPDVNGNPTTYQYWSCVILRGVDWQIDTLPAPPEPTNILCAAGTGVNVIE